MILIILILAILAVVIFFLLKKKKQTTTTTTTRLVVDTTTTTIFSPSNYWWIVLTDCITSDTYQAIFYLPYPGSPWIANYRVKDALDNYYTIDSVVYSDPGYTQISITGEGVTGCTELTTITTTFVPTYYSYIVRLNNDAATACSVGQQVIYSTSGLWIGDGMELYSDTLLTTLIPSSYTVVIYDTEEIDIRYLNNGVVGVTTGYQCV